jgi:hypothetical protein
MEDANLGIKTTREVGNWFGLFYSFHKGETRPRTRRPRGSRVLTVLLRILVPISPDWIQSTTIRIIRQSEFCEGVAA